jgi:hypothetical protein
MTKCKHLVPKKPDKGLGKKTLALNKENKKKY